MDTSEWRSRSTQSKWPTKRTYYNRAADLSFIAAAIITLILAARFIHNGALFILAIAFGGPALGAAIFYTIGIACWKAYCRKFPYMKDH